jgi:surface antigen
VSSRGFAAIALLFWLILSIEYYQSRCKMSNLSIGNLNDNYFSIDFAGKTDPTDTYRFNRLNTGSFRVTAEGFTSVVGMQLLDSQGKVVKKIETNGTNSGTFSIDNLGATNYALKISAPSGDTNYQISLTPDGKVDPLTGLGVDSGFFSPDSTGQVGFDWLHDGGNYKGEVAIFSVQGMEKFTPGSPEFIKEAARRALSNSLFGHVVISDPTEGANPLFNGILGEANSNEGDYSGPKTFAMKPGEAFAVMLVPNGTVQDVFNNPNVGGDKRPLLSLSSLNPDDAFLSGQIADVTGKGKAFAMEDQRVDTGSDKDYNDLVFNLTGATGKAVSIDKVIAPAKDWTKLDGGKKLIDYVNLKPVTVLEPPVEPKPPVVAPPTVDPKPPVAVEPPVVTPPVVEPKPPVAVEPPAIALPPVEPKPPAIVLPPVEPKPPVAVEPPVVEPKPPVAVEPPVVALPPVEPKPPVAVEPPVTKTPPVEVILPVERPIAPAPPIEPKLPVEPPAIAPEPPTIGLPPIYDMPQPIDPEPPVEPPVLPISSPPDNRAFIGIIDTGFATNNPDLDYSQVTLGRDRIDKDSNPLFTAGTGNEHGTFSWGLVSAIQGNDKGIDGYNDQANIYLSRAIGSGEWDLALTDFVTEAKAQKKKNAIALLPLDLTQKNADGSITTRYEFTNRERAALENARQNGVLLVVAAGNDGDVMSVLGQSSQEFENILTVGSSDGFGRSDYSSYGYGLDILVPGGTIDNPTLSTVGDDVGTMSGTSTSAAKAAGMASKVWEANPDLSMTQVIDVLTGSAIDLKDPGWDEETGFGVVNLNKAVAMAKETAPQAHIPTPFSNPTTWGKEGLVTPLERATAAFEHNGQWYDWELYTVKSGDELGLIAQARTGDGNDWVLIANNPDNIIPSGDPNTIYPGEQYWVPKKVSAPQPPVDNPVQPPVDNPVQPPIDNPVQPPIDNPVQPPIDNPVQPPIDNPVQPPPSSISLNGHTIGGNFYPVFQNYQGTLGNPISDVTNYNGASYQLFENGSIVSSANGTFPLYGGIRQAYKNTGGLEGWLGAPTSEEKGLGNGNIIQYFEHGNVYWNGSKAIAYKEGDGQSNYPNFGDNTPTIGGDLSSIPDSISAKRAVSGGGIVDSNIKGSFAKDVVDSINRGIIREEVGLFVMSILATESGGGNWQANNGLGYLGAFQMGQNERQAFAPGVSDEEFLANKDIQLKAAEGLYDEKLKIIQNKAQTGELHLWTTEPDQQPLDQHFAGKSNIYKAAYAWLTLAGEDGNNVYSKDYAQAADESAKLINQTIGINKGPLSTDQIQQPGGTPLLTPVGLDYFNSHPEFYTTGNRFWHNGSAPSGLGNQDNTGTLGNCTWYAFGRAKELGGSEAALTGMSEVVNAGSWGDRVQAGYAPGAEVVSTPQVGDIAEWIPSQFGNSQYGHVAVVEQVNADGSILISQSSYAVGSNLGYLHRSSDKVPGYLKPPAHFIRVPKV